MVTGLLHPLALLAVAGLVEAPGGGECPTAAAVEARLLPLLPPPAERQPLRAYLERRGDRLRLELRDGDGLMVAGRELLAAAPCDDLAAAAAVVLASAWRAPPSRALPPVQLEEAVTLRRAAPAPPPLPWEVAASAWVSFAGTSFAMAPGVTLEGFLAPRGRRLGVRLAFLGAGLREEALSPGRAAWTRLALSAGPRYRFAKGRLLLGLHGEGLLAVVLARGDGFSESYGSADVDLGLGGGVRVGWRLGPVAPFIGGTLLGWLRPQTLAVSDLGATAVVPRFEVLLAGGLSLGKFP